MCLEGFADESHNDNITKKNETDNTNDNYFHDVTEDYWFYVVDSFRSFVRNNLSNPSAEESEAGTFVHLMNG